LVAALGLVLAVAGLVPYVVHASDHADPVGSREPTSNITGLFIYPDGDRMVLIFNVNPALVAAGPFDLEPFEYTVYMDQHTPITFDSQEDRARYGGTIAAPEGISPDVTIRFRLNNDTTVREQSFDGLTGTEDIRVFTGLRDDPFIFPRFFRRNIIAMAMSIPMTSFPAGQQDWILWGTTSRAGTQIDHVGRSIRTQLPRFGYLNTVPPSQQVAATMDEMRKWDRRYDFLNRYRETSPLAGLIQFTFQIRKYDLVPDVMIYTSRFAPGFPNGRRLADDVVAVTCQVGDCLLQELSYIEGDWPRQTVNDKPFLAEFPYMAEPWPAQAAPPAPPSLLPLAGGVLLLVLVVAVGAFWLFLRWYRKRILRVA
jgi:hypothetical protein